MGKTVTAVACRVIPRGEAQKGVTLLESVVSLAIIAILVATAVPGFRSLMVDAERDGLVNTLVASLHYARSEAVKRCMRVTVCPSASGLDCAGNVYWEQGWIVFADPNSNGTVDAGELVISAQPSVGWAGTLRGSRPRITFQENGFSGGFTDTLRACDERGMSLARSVVISNVGRVRVRAGADACP